MSLEQKEAYIYGNALIMISSYGVVQEIMTYVKLIEKLYINCRSLEELTSSGKIEQGERLEHEIYQTVKSLPEYQILFIPEQNRV